MPPLGGEPTVSDSDPDLEPTIEGLSDLAGHRAEAISGIGSLIRSMRWQSRRAARGRRDTADGPARRRRARDPAVASHRERVVDSRTRLINELRWQLHDLWPDWEIPKRVLIRPAWQTKVAESPGSTGSSSSAASTTYCTTPAKFLHHSSAVDIGAIGDNRVATRADPRRQESRPTLRAQDILAGLNRIRSQTSVRPSTLRRPSPARATKVTAAAGLCLGDKRSFATRLS
jgi:hypothetical protein